MNVLLSNATVQTDNLENIQCEKQALSQGWNLLATNKIFFGHQSVGNNILNGLQLLAAQCNKPLSLLRTRNADKINTPVFAHTEIGENRQPETKLTDFDELIRKGIGKKVDIAFMKFCYIDFQHDTNIDELFTKYTDIMASLSKQYPETKFLAVTVPLTTLKTGIKVLLKNILNGHLSLVSGEVENKKRQEFNERLRLHFNTTNKLFDLAAIESTLPDGSRAKYQFNNKTYYSLYKGYTLDGGHLNEEGQLHVARALLEFLGRL